MLPNVGGRSWPLAVVLTNRQPHLLVEGQLLLIGNGLLAELAENEPIIGGFNVQIAGMTDVVPTLESSRQPFSRKYKKTLVTLQLVTHIYLLQPDIIKLFSHKIITAPLLNPQSTHKNIIYQ